MTLVIHSRWWAAQPNNDFTFVWLIQYFTRKSRVGEKNRKNIMTITTPADYLMSSWVIPTPQWLETTNIWCWADTLTLTTFIGYSAAEVSRGTGRMEGRGQWGITRWDKPVKLPGSPSEIHTRVKHKNVKMYVMQSRCSIIWGSLRATGQK